MKWLCILAIFAAVANAQNSTLPWSYKGEMPVPQMHYSSSMFTKNNEIYLFGKPWNVWVNYFWKYTPANRNWTLINNNVASTPRWFQKGIVYTRNSQENFFIYSGVGDGGIGGNGVPNPAWLSAGLTYNENTQSFENFSPSNAQQGQSASLTFLPYDGTIFMFGGCYNNPNKNSSWIYDFNANSWSSVSVTVNIPTLNSTNVTLPSFVTGRCGHTAVLVESQRKILMFGGHSGGSFLDDLWSYDVDTATWNLIVPDGIAKPSPRCYHTATLVQDIMFVFGGDGPEIRHLDDLWAFSLSYNRWILLSPKGGWPGEQKLSERAHHSASAVGNEIFFYGGLTHTQQGANVFLTDLWSYSIGCANNCSGNGVCDSIVCICNNCTGGADCSVNLCGGSSTTNGNIVTIPAKPKDILLGVILAVVGAIVFVIIAATVTSLIIYRKFKKWKAAKEGKQEGMAELKNESKD